MATVTSQNRNNRQIIQNCLVFTSELSFKCKIIPRFIGIQAVHLPTDQLALSLIILVAINIYSSSYKVNRTSGFQGKVKIVT